VTLIELIWTITPALILIAIAFPSFRLLYLLDEVTSPTITIKVTGGPGRATPASHPSLKFKINNLKHLIINEIANLNILLSSKFKIPLAGGRSHARPLNFKTVNIQCSKCSLIINNILKTISELASGWVATPGPAATYNGWLRVRRPIIYLEDLNKKFNLHSSYESQRGRRGLPSVSQFLFSSSFSFGNVALISIMKFKPNLFPIMITLYQKVMRVRLIPKPEANCKSNFMQPSSKGMGGWLSLARIGLNKIKRQPSLVPFKKSGGISVAKKSETSFINILILNKNAAQLAQTLIMKKGFHTHCRAIKRIGPHNLDVVSVFIGLLLGDGYLSNRSGEGARMSVKQSIIHKEYLFHLYKFFYNRGYCTSLEPRMYIRSLKWLRSLRAPKNKTYYGYEFNTYTFRSLVWLHKLFYKNGKKVIPANIGEFLTPLALTIWISDDGGWTGSGLRISANSFNLEEVKLLKEVLTTKFELECTIQNIYIKDRYSIYIKKSSIFKLRTLILPYLHESMLNKVGL
jgi:hypothetical protein